MNAAARRCLLLLGLLAAVGCGEGGDTAAATGLRAMTFNTGTSEGLPHDAPPADGYGRAEAAISDAWYGDGLAWRPVVEDARRFLAAARPDVVAFQEIFHADDCAAVPADARPGWVCEDWQPGAPTVALQILGPGFQVACHPGKPDKCLGVRRAFARIRGCDADFCLDGLEGVTVAGCGGGSRVGRAVLELAAGGTLTVVSVHGTSGFAAADIACREAQFAQVFADFGDGSGAPAANGGRNLVLGDFNTDPARATRLDASARALAAAAGADSRFRFVSAVGADAPPTYAGVFNIDHVITDAYAGSCWSPGIGAGGPPVSPVVYFDHVPVVCDLEAVP